MAELTDEDVKLVKCALLRERDELSFVREKSKTEPAPFCLWMQSKVHL